MIINMKKYASLISFIVIVLTMAFGINGCKTQQEKPEESFTLRFEHLANNVPDPVKTADWYKENLGMKIIRQGEAPTFTTFIADPGENMMFEFYHNADAALFNAVQYNHLSIHVAFEAPDLAAVKDKLVKGGATVVDDIKTTPSGDEIMMLRDPWGLPIQFVKRSKQMLPSDSLRFEHIAVNLKDSREVTKWYTENMHMAVMQESGEPNYGRFLADAGKNMMLEFYQNSEAPVINFNDVDFLSIHLASVTSDMEATKAALLKAGATVAQDINKTPTGDMILVLRDPWGFPLQFVQRVEPMLK